MEQSVVASAHTKRRHSPHTAPAPRSSAQKRARVAGSKNLKQHEWALVHQHLVRRTKENKDTTFFIHGIEHTWQNVRRKIVRATSDQIGPLEGTYIVLHSVNASQSSLTTLIRPNISASIAITHRATITAARASFTVAERWRGDRIEPRARTPAKRGDIHICDATNYWIVIQ